MGGKRLKFPTRKKFVPGEVNEFEKEEAKKEVSDEEHEKRMKMLKDMGILKE